VPWNFPVSLMGNKLGPALLTGNTVVVKPAGTTPLTDLRCCELIDKAIQDAGGPRGVLNVVTGPGSVVGEELLVNPTVRKIGFTGATDTGRRVMLSAAKDFKHVTLELGGSDPMIVCDDADIDRAVSAASVGRFFNCGQACLAVKRLYLFDHIADNFVNKLIEKVKKISVGNGLKGGVLMGPLHTAEQRREVEEQVEDAVKRGAKVLYGAQRPKGDDYDKGFYLQPTLVSDVDPASRLLQEECFGPALPIVRVKNLEQAIEQANNSIFGLGSSIWTRDINRAMAGAERIEAGYTWVNSAQIIYDELPFGGVKQSGLGKEHGEEAIEHYTDSKSVVIATETHSEMVGGE
jgi:acyl-CoA reductase-like NAD-dependent aldehyde dehydrogenase